MIGTSCHDDILQKILNSVHLWLIKQRSIIEYKYFFEKERFLYEDCFTKSQGFLFLYTFDDALLQIASLD